MKTPTFPESVLLRSEKRNLALQRQSLTNEVPAPPPEWWIEPATVAPLQSVEDFAPRANRYFRDCAEREERATLTGFCIAIGLPGPTTLLRLGQRVPALRAAISRCCTRIAAGYEAMIGNGSNAGALFMLKNIPDYDPEDPEGSPAVLFFEDRKEIVFHDVAGAAGTEDFEGDALEAYLSIIKRTRPRSLKQAKSDLKGAARKERLLQILTPEEAESDQRRYLEGETID